MNSTGYYSDQGGPQGNQMELGQFNPMFHNTSMERDAQMPSPETQFLHDHPVMGGPPHTLQRNGAYTLHHPYPEQYEDTRDIILEENSMENLLKHLPSRQLESAANHVAKTLRRRHTHRKSVSETMRRNQRAKPSDDLQDMMDLVEPMDAEEEGRVEEAIRSMPATLSTKRSYMKRLNSRKKKAPGKIKTMKYSLGMAWKHFKDSRAELRYSLQLWRYPLKKIEGHFGTGVLSYFLFLKWLLFINIPTVLLTISFVCVPQLLYRWLQQEPKGFVNNTDFTGLELLTGAGWFSETIMYYGYYTTEVINITGKYEYEMQVAYLFTSGGYYLLTLFILGHSILRSYRTFYVESSGAFNKYFINKILGSWDYGITSPEAIKLKQQSYFREIREYLAAKKERKQKTRGELCKIVFLRLFTNLLVLGLLVGSGYLVHFLSGEQVPNSADELKKPLLLMVLPLVIGGIHLILPIIFSIIEHNERYEQPRYELYAHIIRSMLLRLSTLAVLVYYWYNTVAKSTFVPCWETYVGQDIYRLVIIELIFTLLGTFFSEFVRKLLSLKFDKVKRAHFSIGRYTLELIYTQTLCWLGSFYAPLLSLIVVIKLIIIFYVKETSALQNCSPSNRPWRAARAHTIFLGFLFISFLLSTIAVAIGIIFVTPSSGCGPYQGKNNMYIIVTELIKGWQHDHRWLTDFISFVSSPGFYCSILVLIGMGVYYMRTIAIGREETVKRLQQQLVLEGQDRTFLLALLTQVSQRGKVSAVSDSKRHFSQAVKVSSTDFTSPGGRVFVRSMVENSTIAH